jgi:hypothetical protein
VCRRGQISAAQTAEMSSHLIEHELVVSGCAQPRGDRHSSRIGDRFDSTPLAQLSCAHAASSHSVSADTAAARNRFVLAERCSLTTSSPQPRRSTTPPEMVSNGQQNAHS